MTRLSPSTYSSRHTTHSTCRPRYRRLELVDCLGFSGELTKDVDESAAFDSVGKLEAVRERGLGRDVALARNKGVVGDDKSGEDS